MPTSEHCWKENSSVQRALYLDLRSNVQFENPGQDHKGKVIRALHFLPCSNFTHVDNIITVFVLFSFILIFIKYKWMLSEFQLISLYIHS